MSLTEIREQLHKYIDQADDKKIQAIYTMVEDDIHHTDVWNDESFVYELEKRVAEIESGEVKGHTWEEVQALAAIALDKAKSK